MTKEINFIDLKNELSKADVIFKNKDGLSKLYFNRCSDSKSFKTKLDLLFDRFSNELRLNLSSLDSTSSKENYLECILQEFLTLEENVGENPNYIESVFHRKLESSQESSYITIRKSEIFDLINYFNCQKSTILTSIKLIKRCRHKFTDRSKRLKLYNDSWKDELQEFYPFFMRFKDEMSNVNSIQERITYLKKSRKEITAEFSKKNMDFYGSPLNLYFEARLDCLKDLLHSKDTLLSAPLTLEWKGSKTDFIELVLSLKLSDVITMKDGRQITRKKLFSQFESFLGMEPINDLASRIHKLKSRSNRSPFLNELKENCDRFLNDEE